MLVNSPSDFDILKIGLAAPDQIRFWSYGEIEKPETINYRTFKPERKGLFCEKIFGPVKDWECSCGKYRRVRYRGIVCERCGVEVTHSKVRRERMGHIELAAPVSHIWFLKGIPSFMGLILDMSSRQLEEVIYYDSYIITEVNDALDADLEIGQILPQPKYQELKEKFKGQFKADMGASAIKTILSNLDLKKLALELREMLENSKGQKKTKITKRLRVIESLQKSDNQPEWMILDAIPVMPPDLRPMVQLEGGRFATSDLNDLYRRVVNRNNRLKRLMDIGAPDMIIRNEKRMLQEAVDVLISNGKRGRSVTGTNGRPLKSLGNIIEGKQGRFRQNLLGKRVDYSARSVIVVGPHLKFHQCGLPKEMALELFKPFVIRKLVELGVVSNVKSAKRKIEKREVVVWDILEAVIKGQLVLLNRAPTLHRLGIQAFEPILVEGSAIQIHPLVCTAFNADFDGDQMAVHVPLSMEAQAECRMLILATNNILSPSSGQSIVTPSQDMILGCYYLTVENSEETKGKGKLFRDMNEARRAFDAGIIGFQSEIIVRINNERVTTTIGRIIFNRTIWDVLDSFDTERDTFVNYVVGKKELSDLIYNWYIKHGNEVTSALADELKRIGFRYSTLSGISISIDDLRIPSNKQEIIDNANKEVEKLVQQQRSGSITQQERQLMSNDIWRSTTQQVAKSLSNTLGQLNNLYIMANSGARGNMDQVRQLAGMRGLMSDAQGRTVNIPIKTNFKEGLSLTEYFISSYGARKGLVDTALRTADSGYLTRRLVDVAQDLMVTIEDCQTDSGLSLSAVKEGLNVMVTLSEMIEGRYASKDVLHPETGDKLIAKNDLISKVKAKEIQDAGVKSVDVRTIYTCKADRGICQKCFGVDLATSKTINVGEAIGIIAAQSIGEPGTQLTMRTFHTGGVDLRKASKIDVVAKESGVIELPENLGLNRIKDDDGEAIWVTSVEGDAYITAMDTGLKRTQTIPKGSTIHCKTKDRLKPGELIAEYDPIFAYVVSENEGSARIIKGSLKSRKNESGKITETYMEDNGEIFITSDEMIQVELPESLAMKYKKGERLQVNDDLDGKIHRGGLITKIEKTDKKTKSKTKKEDIYELTLNLGEAYAIMHGARVFIKDGDKVKKSEILARERMDDQDASKTKDIVQGLPRVEELFEARKPKDAAILSELDGMVDIIDGDGYRIIKVISDEGVIKDYKVAYDVRLQVYSGKTVVPGDQLTDGVINPHDILATKGVAEAQKYLSEEVQRVYRSQGVQINSKHIEVIVRQMTRKVNIAEIGDSEFLPNDLVDIKTLERKNKELEAEGKKPASGEQVLLGITRASLNTESFISASSFQQTASVLTRAAIEGQTDPMYGLKENVIIGKLIPAGTGMKCYRNLGLDLPQSELDADDIEEMEKELEKITEDMTAGSVDN